ncbi:efflux RND transporter periplasmic adaptor subunit [Halonatronum saccharophilum]|uniref:efflux RND transporter periplasmic adaptor subunit n=2 Tax=Halonatronum saccharophilum TaxID=150060 RepID=UPI001FE15682|nr:efflux RND transporter periplasmic adaptor subunit [Halonatronum saccharophilum]
MFRDYKRLLGFVMVIGFLLGFGVACSNRDSDQTLADQESEERVPVEVLEVSLGELSDYISTVGETEPIRSVQVTPQIQGEIEEVMVQRGDRVEAGDILLGLNKDDIKSQIKQSKAALEGAKANLERALKGARVEELSQLEAQLEQAESSYNQAKRAYERQQKLFEEGVISKQQFEGSEGQYISARSAYRSAKLALNIAEEGATDEEIRGLRAQVSQAQAGLESAELMLDRSEVKAPISGVVVGVEVEVGEIGGMGPALFIADIDNIKVMTYVSERNINKLSAGDEVEIFFRALEKSFEGNIRSISPVADRQRGNFPVEITIDNEDNLIKAGMFGEVEFITGKYEDVVVVPQSGVLRNGKDRYVYSYNDGDAIRKEVKTGFSTGDYIVIEEGLEVGDLLIVRGQENIDEGDKVEIVSRGGN